MLIKDMFRKPIDRNIQGVIVVGEDGLNDEKNELEEYVLRVSATPFQGIL